MFREIIESVKEENQELDEIFGFGDNGDKEEVKQALLNVAPTIKQATLNVVHDTLAKLSKAGNKLAKKLLSKIGFNPENAKKVYVKAVA